MTFIPLTTGIVSAGNSSSATLGAGGVFTGTGQICTKYATVTVTVESDVPSAPCGVEIQFSSDGINWDINRSYTFTAVCDFVKTFIIPNKFIRVVYTNGTSAQTVFRLQTVLQVGKTPTDDPQMFLPAPGIQDAFGRLRVSNPQTLVEVTHVRGNNDTQETRTTTGAGSITLNANSPYQTLAVVSNGDAATTQSRQRGIYQPGKSLLIFATGVLNNATNAAGVVTRIGYFDDDDGIYYQNTGNGSTGTTAIVKRTSGSGAPVNTVVNQADWNVDKMDGNGISGITLDFSKTIIYTIDLEWLGVGRVRVGFVVGGNIFYAHEFIHSNELTLPYMNLGSQPVRHQIISTGGAGSMTNICSSVMSEGGITTIGRVFSATRGITTVSIGTTVLPVISLRLKTTTRDPKVNIVLTDINLVSTSGGNMAWYYYIFRDTAAASILTGASWVSADTESACEFDISATAVTLTNGILIKSGYFSNNADLVDININSGNNTTLTSNINGLTDVIVIVMQSIAGTETIGGAISWRELL